MERGEDFYYKVYRKIEKRKFDIFFLLAPLENILLSDGNGLYEFLMTSNVTNFFFIVLFS